MEINTKNIEQLKDQVVSKSREYVEKGKVVAADITEKGKAQAKLVSAQAKLSKAQRQLGALVYSLARGNEENQPLVDNYIEMIGSIEDEIAQLKAVLAPATAAEVEQTEEAQEADIADVMEQTEQAEETEPADAAEEAPAEKPNCCPQCGAPVSEGSLFCNHCGAQL